MNILYVEDEPNDARLVSLYVNATAHTLTVATTRREAEMVYSPTFDLILIDVMLEYSREGYNIAQFIRGKGYTGPVVAVTGLVSGPDQNECRRAGFTAVLSKPYSIRQLAALIQQYDGNHKDGNSHN